jgi:polyisoprenoid-binding protein YceI
MKTSYRIDPVHSSAQFIARHMMITNVRGSFSGVQGTVVYDPANPAESSIEAVIDVNTISTGEPQRDAHLKSADFLLADKYPTITFKSAKVEPAGDGEWNVTGALTIRGVTRDVALKVEGPATEGNDPWGNVRSGASAATKIKRGDFGLSWNAALETGGFLVGDDVKISVSVQAIAA